MKKILFSLSLLFLFTGCSLSNTPTSKVESYLNQYNNLTDNVIEDIDTTVAAENLNSDNTLAYKEVLKRQYKDLKYEVKEESIDGEEATVKVKITVYDLYLADKNSREYMNSHMNEFYDNDNMFDENLYYKYKIENMSKVSDKMDYDITFKLVKKDKEWVLQTPDRVTLEKIHGLYNYEND